MLLFIVMGTSCQNKQGKTTIIENVRGYTLYKGVLSEFSSMAFRDGKVLDIAGDGPLDIAHRNARVIDGEGRVMLPGLIDAHGHVMKLGYNTTDVNLAGTESLDEALSRVARYAAENPELPWVRGSGWNHTRWEINRYPTAGELDQVVEDRPVWLRRIDEHAGWANSKAMELAGITSETQAPEDGKIVRFKDSAPAGIFVDDAMDLVASAIPRRTREEREEALSKALRQLRTHGLTSVHDAGIDKADWELYKQFADRGKMATRIYGMIDGTGGTFDTLSENGPITSFKNDLLALRSVKIYADGALGSRGAALLEDYSDEAGTRGLLFSTEQELTDMIMKSSSRGYQTSVHAIGDRANRVVLNAFDTVKEKLGERGLRNRIEHAQVVSRKDIPRFKELDIIASMQPAHATSDMNMAENRIGPERLEGAYAWQRFLRHGTVVASGSDFPVEHVNPFYGLYAAVARKDHEGNPEGGWYAGQAMTRQEAFRSFTLDAAYAAHQEEVLGSLEPDKWADFILIDRDYFEIPENEIWRIEVLETWLAGKKVYDATGGQ